MVSAWEFIGWMIAVPMALFTGLLAYAFLVAVVKLSVKRRKETATKERHLKIVD